MKKCGLTTAITVIWLVLSNGLLGQTDDVFSAKKRLVYHVPDMENVIKHEGIVYYSKEGVSLKFDLYKPPNIEKDKKLPLVILMNGYPDDTIKNWFGVTLKDLGILISWAELIASSGMIAVKYESQKSPNETDTLIKYLTKKADTYSIDLNRIAIFGCSANTLIELSLMQNSSYHFKCAIFYYGILLTPDQKFFNSIDSAAKELGFYWTNLRAVKKFPQEVPFLIVKAGKDARVIKETTDYFVSEITKSDIQFTFINYPDGQHDFDVLDDTPTSRDIIKQTISFLKFHLMNQ